MARAIQSVERAAALLRLLGGAGRPLALAELAAALDLPRPTAHGLLRTLREEGLVAQESSSGRYLLGEGLGRLGTPWDRHDLRARAMNWADALAAGTGCAVYLGVPSADGAGVDLVHHVFRPDDTPQRLRTNTTQPLHATAWGRCLLAFAPASVRAVEPLETYTRATVTDPAALTREITATRRRGWAADAGGWEPGAGGLAVPVRSGGGLTVAALGIGAPVEELFAADGRARPEVVVELVAAAAEIADGLEGLT
ncbi:MULTISPECIES: IclR family transcriptional regulator [Pseudonocardia]|uniref:IclR family transcriptional regulator n=1 Tax=Pseudonocardia TaxID=1847 RepID=UPI0015BFD2B4|nr:MULTISPECIES: IclR family transcriptional regulator C-terminal domain-containing protein [Pseudonocardia]MBO4238328.1 helix-turn-helix domain-containing protein [Pseudonocardia alni]MCM3849454.1 helix-turn-helix domain-containing protein [Pseudonocardia sp. DR1-2]NWJ70829.1 helix-turn-helix domain-containing protein [Pseudonocardia pini]WFG42790.1 helix-turn-helix domain-containing protein [Pseudonocardia alni]